MKQTLQSRFLHFFAAYLSSGTLPPLIMGPPSIPFILKLFPIPNLFHLITVSFRQLPLLITPEEANLPKPYWTTLSQLRSFFCSSLHSYRERIRLTNPWPPLFLLWSVTHYHRPCFLLFLASDTPDRVGSVGASEFQFLPFFDLPPLPPPPPEPPSGGQES